MSVSWSASTDNVGVVGYGVYLGGELATTEADLGTTLINLKCGTSYTVGVDAHDRAGNRSGKASKVVATPSCSQAQGKPDKQSPGRPESHPEAKPTTPPVVALDDTVRDRNGLGARGQHTRLAPYTRSTGTGTVNVTSRFAPRGAVLRDVVTSTLYEPADEIGRRAPVLTRILDAVLVALTLQHGSEAEWIVRRDAPSGGPTMARLRHVTSFRPRSGSPHVPG